MLGSNDNGESSAAPVQATTTNNVNPSPPPSPANSIASFTSSSCRRYINITSDNIARISSEVTEEPEPLSPSSSSTHSSSAGGGFFHRVRTTVLRSNTSPSLTPTSPTTTGSSATSTPSSPGSKDVKKIKTQRRKSSGDRRVPTHLRMMKEQRRHSGGFAHYGRHSNEWLFGGFSVRETFKSVLSSD